MKQNNSLHKFKAPIDLSNIQNEKEFTNYLQKMGGKLKAIHFYYNGYLVTATKNDMNIENLYWGLCSDFLEVRNQISNENCKEMLSLLDILFTKQFTGKFTMQDNIIWAKCVYTLCMLKKVPEGKAYIELEVEQIKNTNN